MTPALAAVVLAAFEKADDYDSLMWRVTHRPGSEADVKLFAQCSDFFHYATADAEEIEGLADVELLEACLADLVGTEEEFYLAELFAARKRKLRPLPIACQGMTTATQALFDAAGTAEARDEADRQDKAFWAHVGHKIRTGELPGAIASAAQEIS